MNKYIGAHVSTSGGVENSIHNAKEIGAKALALFVKNQRQWNAKPLSEESVKIFKNEAEIAGFFSNLILPHAGYLINLGHPQEENRLKSVESFVNEMERCAELGLTMLNIHPGSHLKEITEIESLDLVVKSIEQAFTSVPRLKIVLENTAGQGSNLGYKFEHLSYVIERISDKNRIGVCLDTCHTYSAGYDIKTVEGYSKTMDEFERIVGFKYLSGIHLNDSKTAFASRKDRHESIGKGSLGLEFFKRFVNDSRFDNIPIILETIDESIWKQEIDLLYSMIS